MHTVPCKYGSMEREVRERAVKGRHVIGALKEVIKKDEVLAWELERNKKEHYLFTSAI